MKSVVLLLLTLCLVGCYCEPANVTSDRKPEHTSKGPLGPWQNSGPATVRFSGLYHMEWEDTNHVFHQVEPCMATYSIRDGTKISNMRYRFFQKYDSLDTICVEIDSLTFLKEPQHDD